MTSVKDHSEVKKPCSALGCVVSAAANQIPSFGPATCTTADPNSEGSGFPEWSTTAMLPVPVRCDAVEVRITAGQILEAALVTERGPHGNYRNNACQRWNVVTTEGQVRNDTRRSLDRRCAIRVTHRSQKHLK